MNQPARPPGPVWATPPPPPTPTSLPTVRPWAVIAFGVVCLGACVTIIDHAGPDQPKPAAAPSPARQAQTKTTHAAAPKSTPKHTDEPVGKRFAQWSAGGGSDLIRNLASDAQDISTASGEADIDAVRIACEHLGSDVAEAQAYEPMPDAEAQQHWAASLDSYGSAASDCTAAMKAGNAAQLTRSGLELQAGTMEVTKASERISVIATGS
jgi:hypothetical protein